MGAQRCPLGLHALWGPACCWGGGGLSWEGGPPLLRGASGVRRCPSPCCPSFGGLAARVPRPVGPGCGWCGRGDPVPAPQRVPSWAVVARCRGGERASPGGCCVRRCERRLSSGAPPPPAFRPLGGPSGSATYVLLVRVCGCRGPACTVPLACVPCGGLCAAGYHRGSSPGGGWPSPFGRGVWRHALSLFWPLVLWGGQPGFRDPCVPGAVGAGVPEWRPQGGGAFHRCEGRLSSGAPPPPAARSPGGLLGPATNVLWARVCGCGGPALSLWLACPVGAACRGGGRGPSPGGWPSTLVRGVWCQALSLLRPPVLWSGQAGFRGPCVPGAVGVGVGTQHRPHSVCPCEPSLPAVGAAEGRLRRGCLSPLWGASEFRRFPSPGCPPSGRAVGVRYPRAVGAGMRVWGPSTVPLARIPWGGLRAAGLVGDVPGGAGLPSLRGASGVRRCPSPGRPSSGAGSQGFATRVSQVRLVWAWGPSTVPTACALASCRCALRVWRKGVPGGGALRRFEGRLRSGAPPHPVARPLGGLSGSATHVLWARVCGCGGPALAPWLACPSGGCAPQGWWGASGFRRPPFPGCPPSGRAVGARWLRAVGAGVGACGVCGVCAVRAVVRGAAHRLSP